MTDAPQTKIEWRRHTIAGIGLSLDVVDGIPVSEGAAGGISYALQERDGIKIGVWFGPGRDLAAWRGFYGEPRSATFTAETQSDVCGRPARRQAAEVAEGETARALIQGDDGTLSHRETTFPALHAEAIAFDLRGNAVLVELVVRADRRDELSGARKHFFAAIVCEA